MRVIGVEESIEMGLSELLDIVDEENQIDATFTPAALEYWAHCSAGEVVDLGIEFEGCRLFRTVIEFDDEDGTGAPCVIIDWRANMDASERYHLSQPQYAIKVPKEGFNYDLV